MLSYARRWSLAFLVAVLVGAGCSSSKTEATAPPPVIDPTVKGMEILGNGTDVFGLYAVEDNVKGRVLNVDALNAAGLLVYSPNVQEYRYEETSGHSMSQYVGQRSASLGLSGSYMFFSAELKTTFSNDTYRRDDYSYASIIERHWKHALKVAPGIWNSGTFLRPYLHPLARKAIDDTDTVKWTGADVIAAYGTHVMNGIYVGARLDYHLAIQILDESNRNSLSVFVKAKYGKGFVSAGVEVDISETTYNEMNSYQQAGPVINAKGGAAQYAHPEDNDQYVLWKASLDSNPVFCGIVDGGLLGIWELAPTIARRNEILAAYQAYAASEGAGFTPIVGRITDLVLLDAGSGSGEYGEHARPTVTPPTGFELLKNAAGESVMANLNKDIWDQTSHANYVHLAFKSEVTEQPVGVASLHFAAAGGDTALDTLLHPGGHAAVFGDAATRPGCSDPSVTAVNLNLGTAHDVVNFHDWLDCGRYVWGYDAANAPGTPLFLHYVMEPEQAEPIRCIVVGDPVAIDATQPFDTRIQHIHWGPYDVNHDGPAGDPLIDAKWVLGHVTWLRDANGNPVNVNLGTQSYALYNYWCQPWPCCWSGCCGHWDDGWAHGFEAPEDAQYLGVCYLTPPP